MIRVGPLLTEEIAAFLPFLMEIGGDAATQNSISGFLSQPQNLVLLAWAEGKPVGWIRAFELPEIEAIGSMMLLFEIDVLESHRRQGVARALVEELKRVAKDRGCREVWVVTEDDNEPARRLYESSGLQCRTTPDRMYWCDL